MIAVDLSWITMGLLWITLICRIKNAFFGVYRNFQTQPHLLPYWRLTGDLRRIQDFLTYMNKPLLNSFLLHPRHEKLPTAFALSLLPLVETVQPQPNRRVDPRIWYNFLDCNQFTWTVKPIYSPQITVASNFFGLGCILFWYKLVLFFGLSNQNKIHPNSEPRTSGIIPGHFARCMHL